MVKLPDTRGLICGFRLRENGACETLSWDSASDPNRGFEGGVWLHFSLGDVRAERWISACERIPARARQILLDDNVAGAALLEAILLIGERAPVVTEL